MAIPAIIGGAITAVQGISKVSSMFGPSPEFQARQVTSDEFFSLRNEIYGLEDYMSPELLTEWRALSFHAVDFNTRRENAAERAELTRFAEKLNRYLATAVPDSRLLAYGPNLKTSVGTGPGLSLAGVTSGGPLLLIAAGVIAWIIFR